jgi:hypothetical protein
VVRRLGSGLAAYSGNDGLHAWWVRGRLSRGWRRLIARNDEVLGQATTDAQGYARLEPGLLRGTAGQAPALLLAQGPDGDYGLLDLTKTPFDLSDRGVEGRPAPKPLDVYLVTERGAYRPGETVHVTALVRDARHTPGGMPLTLILKRPDGVGERYSPRIWAWGPSGGLALGATARDLAYALYSIPRARPGEAPSRRSFGPTLAFAQRRAVIDPPTRPESTSGPVPVRCPRRWPPSRARPA